MPHFRANYSKLALKLARRLPERDAILRAAGDESVRRIGEAGMLEWLPAERHMAVTNAVQQILGATSAQSFWRDLMLLSFEGRLLKPLVQGGLRLFGRTPRAILRLSPQAYSLIARECGEISVSDDRGRVRLDFNGLPGSLRTPGFVSLCHGNCLAVLAFVDRHGIVDAQVTSLQSGSFALLLH
jgi:hypothetical protein